MQDQQWYPKTLNVSPEGTPGTVDFLKSVYPADKAFDYAEFGIWKADTARNVCENFPNARLFLFDFEENVVAAQAKLAAFPNTIRYFGNSQRFNDSYNWSLGKLMEETGSAPIFDYCFLDGAHTFTVDALNYFLCDRMLRVGGYMDFDDYGWTLRRSSLNPKLVPAIRKQYTKEQIGAKQVKMIVETLVRTDPRYVQVVENKVFHKVA